MAKCKVWNKHPEGLTHKEKFRDEMVEIKAGEYVVMDYEDAVRFRGQYFPMLKNAQGAPDPRGFKVIHLEPIGVPNSTKEYICHLDGAKFPSQALLDKYVKTTYPDTETVKDESLDEEISMEKAKKPSSKAAKEKSL